VQNTSGQPSVNEARHPAPETDRSSGDAIGNQDRPVTVDGDTVPAPLRAALLRGIPGLLFRRYRQGAPPGSEGATLNDTAKPGETGPSQWAASRRRECPCRDTRPSTPGSHPGRAGRLLSFRGGNGSHTTPPGCPEARFGARGKGSEQDHSCLPRTGIGSQPGSAPPRRCSHPRSWQSPTTVSFE